MTIRDIVVKPWNTNYEIEIFYFPSEGKTDSGKLPDGVKGEFGPGLRTLILTLYHVANVSEPKIHEFLENMGVWISRATISRIVTEDNDLFHEEKFEIFQAGLRGCLKIHISHLLKDLIRPSRLIIICIIAAYTNA